MIPVLAPAYFRDFPLDILLFSRFLLDCTGKLTEKPVPFKDIFRSGRTVRRSVHFLQKFSNIQVIVLVGYQLLFMYAVCDETVLTADIASFYRIELKGECRTAAGVIVDFGFNIFRIDIFQHQVLNRYDVVLFHPFHENARTCNQPLKRLF